jgi:hypothetical protein
MTDDYNKKAIGFVAYHPAFEKFGAIVWGFGKTRTLAKKDAIKNLREWNDRQPDALMGAWITALRIEPCSDHVEVVSSCNGGADDDERGWIFVRRTIHGVRVVVGLRRFPKPKTKHVFPVADCVGAP